MIVHLQGHTSSAMAMGPWWYNYYGSSLMNDNSSSDPLEQRRWSRSLTQTKIMEPEAPMDVCGYFKLVEELNVGDVVNLLKENEIDHYGEVVEVLLFGQYQVETYIVICNITE